MKRTNNTNSITIIGEGETEWFYFESLRLAHQYPFKIEPGFPQHADISHFIKLAKDKVREEYTKSSSYWKISKLLIRKTNNRNRLIFHLDWEITSNNLIKEHFTRLQVYILQKTAFLDYPFWIINIIVITLCSEQEKRQDEKLLYFT